MVRRCSIPEHCHRDVDSDSDSEDAALLLDASALGDSTAVRSLLQRSGDKVFKDEETWAALRCAAKHGHHEIVSTLLGRLQTVSEASLKAGLRPAAFSGHVEVVRTLIGRGADVNLALLHATARGQLQLIDVLLALGADINCVSETGQTPLSLAAQGGDVPLVRHLLQNGAWLDSEPLLQAASRGHVEVACALWEVGCHDGLNVDHVDRLGRTVLMRAAANGHVDVVTLLLNWGADVEGVDPYGQTALFHAACNAQLRVVELLIEQGASVDVQDSDGKTLLVRAAEAGKGDLVELLLRHGADVHVADDESWTAMLYAASAGHVEILEMLLAHGAHVSLGGYVTSDARGVVTSLSPGGGVTSPEPIRSGATTVGYRSHVLKAAALAALRCCATTCFSVFFAGNERRLAVIRRLVGLVEQQLQVKLHSPEGSASHSVLTRGRFGPDGATLRDVQRLLQERSFTEVTVALEWMVVLTVLAGHHELGQLVLLGGADEVVAMIHQQGLLRASRNLLHSELPAPALCSLQVPHSVSLVDVETPFFVGDIEEALFDDVTARVHPNVQRRRRRMRGMLKRPATSIKRCWTSVKQLARPSKKKSLNLEALNLDVDLPPGVTV